MNQYGKVREIQEYFFGGRLDFIITSHEIKFMDWHWQSNLLSVTLDHPRVKQYPMSNSYIRAFIKKIISYLENNQDIHDGFYTHLGKVMNDNEFYHRHYLLKGIHGEPIITIKETKSMVVNGTTGMRTWEAALVLADWAISDPLLMRHKKVLELGSGVGLSGITIADQCSPFSVYLSDCHEQVLQTICENIKINFPQMTEETGYENQEHIVDAVIHNSSSNGCLEEIALSVTKFVRDDSNLWRHGLLNFHNRLSAIKQLGVVSLDWNHYDNLPKFLKPDIIVGADIIYDPEIITPLCELLKKFFERNPYLEVYIASTIRNPETFKIFLNTLDALDFQREELETPRGTYFQWDQKAKVCILKIFKFPSTQCPPLTCTSATHVSIEPGDSGKSRNSGIQISKAEENEINAP